MLLEDDGGATPRDAATVVLVRRDGAVPRVLMGQRGAGASFMPSKFVFPGGAVDEDDHHLARALGLTPPDALRLSARLGRWTAPDIAAASVLTAVRETFEETGLIIGHAGARPPVALPRDWESFFATGHVPAVGSFSFIFRAITPPRMPKRFDARFFMIDISALANDPDDFSAASGELAHLHWLPIEEARALPTPFVTGVVLAEVEARLMGEHDRPAPFFRHDAKGSWFEPL